MTLHRRAVSCALLAAVLYGIAAYIDSSGIALYQEAARAASPDDMQVLHALEWLIPFMSRIAHGLAPALFAAGIVLESLARRDAQRSAGMTSRS